MDLVELLVPIFVCVVLPVAIVYITSRKSSNEINKRTDVLIKAIESNIGIDADKLAEAFSKKSKSAGELLNQRLLRGCMWSLIGIVVLVVGLISNVELFFEYDLILFGGISLAVGLSYLIVYFISRKQIVNDEK